MTDMTLAFELTALRRLSHPSAAVDDAHEWSENVGIVTEGSPAAVMDFANRWNIDEDFTSGERGLAGSLAVVRQQFPTERHVFVGASDADRALAQSLGWEYIDVTEAATKAGWELEDN